MSAPPINMPPPANGIPKEYAMSSPQPINMPPPITAIPIRYPPAPMPPGEMRTSSKAVSSLVCGIFGFLIFGLILGPIAIILGMQAKAEINQNPREIQGNGQATAGIIIGVVDIVAWIILVILLF